MYIYIYIYMYGGLTYLSSRTSIYRLISAYYLIPIYHLPSSTIIHHHLPSTIYHLPSTIRLLWLASGCLDAQPTIPFQPATYIHYRGPASPGHEALLARDPPPPVLARASRTSPGHHAIPHRNEGQTREACPPSL